MTKEMIAMMTARVNELEKSGKTAEGMKVDMMGCCGRADGSYRCSSK